VLCEVEDVRGFLQKPEEDTEQDEQIQVLIVAVGSTIAQYCEREFESAGDTVLARRFEYRGGGILSLAPFDLRELTEVRVDVDTDSPVTLAADEVRLPPSSSGTYTRLRLAPHLSRSGTNWAELLVEVKGKWGFAEVPPNVKQAAILTVATWLRRDVSAFSTTLRLEEDRLERPDALPTTAARLLDPYKAHAYA